MVVASLVTGTAPAGTIFTGGTTNDDGDVVTFNSPVLLTAGSTITITGDQTAGTGTFSLRNITVSPVPEPSSLALLGIAMVLTGLGRRNRRR